MSPIRSLSFAILVALAGCGAPSPDALEAQSNIVPLAPTSCGHEGEPCCPPNGNAHYACNGDGSDTDYYSLQCNAGRCERCGMPGLKCCNLARLWCRGDDPTNQKYTCRNMVCEYTTAPPPVQTCNGTPATASAKSFTLLVRDSRSRCGNVDSIFANSEADATACAQAEGFEVMPANSTLNEYVFGQYSTVVEGHCVEVTKHAYSTDDAQKCADWDCQNDSCKNIPGKCLGGVGNSIPPPPPPSPTCSATSSCSCAGQICHSEADISCATIGATQVVQLQRSDASWSSFASASANDAVISFSDWVSKGPVVYRVCNVDADPPVCTPPMTVTVAADATCQPAPPPTCRRGWHWCGDVDGCYPARLPCD